jgi:hypothetical protein
MNAFTIASMLIRLSSQLAASGKRCSSVLDSVVLAFALRRQRSHVRIVSGAPLLQQLADFAGAPVRLLALQADNQGLGCDGANEG